MSRNISVNFRRNPSTNRRNRTWVEKLEKVAKWKRGALKYVLRRALIRTRCLPRNVVTVEQRGGFEKIRIFARLSYNCGNAWPWALGSAKESSASATNLRGWLTLCKNALICSRLWLCSGLVGEGCKVISKEYCWFWRKAAMCVDVKSEAIWLGRGGPLCREQDTWLILPVVICLSQRLSHACVSTSRIWWSREWLITTAIVY